MDIQAVQDKLEIHELLARYARGCRHEGLGALEERLHSRRLRGLQLCRWSGRVPPMRSQPGWRRDSKVVPMTQHLISNIEVGT